MMAVTQQSSYSTPQQLPSASHYIYMHSNPPKPLISASSSVQSSQNTAVRNWVKNGDIDKLENLVLEGQGARLLGLTDTTSDTKVKSFLRGIPGYMAKVDLIHDAVIRGSIRELQTLLDKKKLSLARDAVGRGLAHKAVLHSQRSVIEFLARKYPESIQIRDNESRTCLHYSALSKNPTDMYTFLLNLGAAPEVIDIHGRKASYYLTNPQELYIEGVNGIPSSNSFKSRSKPRFQSQRRRISPISPKSSPSPPVSQPIQIQSSNSAGSKSPVYVGGSQITRAQIRIWIHEKDISKLESIVWSGNGDKLLLETTNNPKVRRFLDNVPSLLHHIKLIHTAAIHNDVDGLKEIRSRIEQNNTADNEISIARELFTSKDSYGMTAMHKATGLNNRAAAEWLLYEFPSTLNLQDNFKRTPMHYGAVRVASDPNSPTSIYSFLKKAGADQTVLDYKQKDPPYYLRTPGDCDSFKFLRNIPDAPRVLTNPERVILGWDRSGVLYRAGAVGAAALSGNKRKISATSGDEFGESTFDGEKLEDMELGSGSKVARTSARDDDEEAGFDENDFLDEEDEIADVGDGYVADSDEGKYELNTEDVVIGDTVVEEEEEEKEPADQGGEEAVVEDAPQPDPEVEQEQEEEKNETSEETAEKDVPEPEESQPDEEPEPDTKNEEEESENVAVEEAQEPEPLETEEPPEPEAMEPEVTDPPEPEPIEPENPEPEPVEPDNPEPESVEPENPEPEELEPETAATEEVESEELPEASAQPEEEEPMDVEMGEEPPSDDVDQSPPNYIETVESPEVPVTKALLPESEESVDAYIQNADMESLVNMVLKGRGHELANKQTSNVEIQEFLQNVPAYMAKINSIHQSAYTGNMRDLQSLLDRKRLAEAQDSVGRGPLHHGVLGNNSAVVRYLVNGYPQCIDLPDSEGRTALHYASVLPDSGTMYKVLIQAGADPNVKDSKGNTPGIYLRRKDLLKLEDLINATRRTSSRKRMSKSTLSRTSNVDTWERPETPISSEPQPNADTEEPQDIEQEDDTEEKEVDEPLVEQVEFRQATNFPAIWSEEGKYLANVLGDALVKGLSLVSQERPNDPVEYLSNFLRGYKDGEEEDPDGFAAAAVVAGGVAAAGMVGAAIDEQQAEDKEQEAAEDEPAPSDDQPVAIEEQASSPEQAPEPESASAPEQEPEEPEPSTAPEEESEEPEPSTAPEEESAEPEPSSAPEQESETSEKVVEETELPTSTEDVLPTTEEPATGCDMEDNEQPPEEEPAPEEMQQDHVPSTPEPEAEEATLNTELNNLEDKLEDALDEEESNNVPFDPVNDEKAEQALLTSRLIEPGEDGDVNAFSGANSTRDDSGQSVLHFACTRPGGGSTIMAFLQNPSVNLAWRDAKLRTARDVASNLNRSENVRVIDNYIVMLAQRGELDALTNLLIDGYEHLADVEDPSGTHIVEVADNAGNKECAQLLRSAPEFRERVERVQRCVRSGDIDGVKSLVTQDKRVGYAINPRTGRNALHVAVLCEEIPIVKWLADNCVEAVKKTDNLERTCLHLSMGVDKCEKIVRILVRAGAKRVVKDLSEKQPSYYWNNRNIIGDLQAEERAILN